MTMNKETVGAKRAVLKARAAALAREPEALAGAKEDLDLVGFSLGSENYAIESSFVREICHLKDFSALPGAPAFVLGLINVRGQIISVVDLKEFFNFPRKGIAELNRVIILRNGRMEFAILADEIQGALRLASGSLRGAPATVTGIGAEYIKGIGGGNLIVLDAEKILGDSRIVVRQEAE